MTAVQIKPLSHLCVLLMIVSLLSCRSTNIEQTWSVDPRDGPDFHLDYTVKYAGDRLAVELAFAGDVDGETVLLLPSYWAGEEELWKGIRDLELVNHDARLSYDAEHPERVVVQHFPSQKLRLRYELEQSFDGPLMDHRFRPILADDYMHVVGHGMLIQPEWDGGREVDVRFRWRDFPDDWQITNSWGHEQRDQAIRIPFADLRHALYLAGDFRTTRVEIGGQPVWVAIIGNPPFQDARFTEVIERVVQTERDFWRDHDFPHFLVALLPGGENCCTFAGTGLTNSFTTIVSADRWHHDEMVFLLAHELFHTWNGQKIVQAPRQGRRMFWFSEGFTSYYTWILNLRAGLIDLPMYVQQYNEDIAGYWLSRVREAPATRIDSDFWNDFEVQRLPYWRGEILAHRWNQRIRSRSGGERSLDDFMRATMDAEVRVDMASIGQLAAPFLGENPFNELRKHMDEGALLRPGEGDLGPCVTLLEKPVGYFDLGFDLEAAEETGKLVGVRSGGSAWEAGLRNGQEVLAWDIKVSKPFPRENIMVLVRDGKGERKVTYFPVGETSPVPQYVVDEDRLRADPDSCLSWFQGR